MTTLASSVASSASGDVGHLPGVPVVVVDGGHRLPDVGPGHPRHRLGGAAGLLADLVAQPGAHLLDLGLGAGDQQQALLRPPRPPGPAGRGGSGSSPPSCGVRRASRLAGRPRGSIAVAIRAPGSSPRSGAGSWLCSTLSASLARACRSRASGSVSSCTSRKSRRSAAACSCQAACMSRGTLRSSIASVAGASSRSRGGPPTRPWRGPPRRSAARTRRPCPRPRRTRPTRRRRRRASCRPRPVPASGV